MHANVVTFHKCGSNWFRQVFRDAAGQHGWNIAVDRPNNSQVNVPVDVGGSSTLTLYRTCGPNAIQAPNAPTVLCVRDPKDVLISQYFSWRNTHRNNGPVILRTREKLMELDPEQGMMLLVKDNLLAFNNAARRWIGAFDAPNCMVLRYEDLLADFQASVSPTLEKIGLGLSDEAVAEIKERYDFSRFTKKRTKSVDTQSHFRKGKSGDWRNYFTPQMTEAFNANYGDVCDALGYDRPDMSEGAA